MLPGPDRQPSPAPSSPTPSATRGPGPSERGEGSTPASEPEFPSPGSTGEGVGGEGRAVGGAGRHRLIPALLGIQILLAAVALAVWVWTPDRPALPPLPGRTAPLVGSGATYESALAIAQAQAEAWLPGAILLNASMQVDWPWSVPPG